MNVETYEQFFRDYYPYICKILNKYGVHYQDIKDISSDIVLSIIEQDGLGKFDPDKNVRIRTYITSYVIILAKAKTSRASAYYKTNILVDEFPIGFSSEYYNGFEETGLYDNLVRSLDGDALTFLHFADESKDYKQARKQLSDMGWEKNRITAAVKSVRKTSQQLVSA